MGSGVTAWGIMGSDEKERTDSRWLSDLFGVRGDEDTSPLSGAGTAKSLKEVPHSVQNFAFAMHFAPHSGQNL